MDPSQPLCQVAAWVIGEYGNVIVGHTPPGGEPITEDALIDTLEVQPEFPFFQSPSSFPFSISPTYLLLSDKEMLRDSLSSPVTRDYALTALAKLSTRISRDDRLKALIASYRAAVDAELQVLCKFFP